ncbi:MAG: hypothetical protein PHE83_09425 [Opitutaceae bacterium]|nr:hypothetical protein [Opitutaceae bacterium]
MSALSHFSTLKLGPGAIDSINAEGKNFWIVFAPVSVQVMYPGGEFGTYEQGTGLDNLPNGETFKRLTVRNPTLGTITVVIYVGGPLYRDARAAVMEPKTAGIGQAAASLAATSGLTLDGIPTGLLIRRKSIQLTNLDPNLRLQIRDSSGNILATVFKEQTYILPISESVEFYNPNGSAVACNISEIWWTL